jgi:hypothetical protein
MEIGIPGGCGWKPGKPAPGPPDPEPDPELEPKLGGGW